MKVLVTLVFLLGLITHSFSQTETLNIVVIGSHPDDPDVVAGGTAIKFSLLGHRVLFVSMTNGDAGHFSKGGGELARIRSAEAEEAGKRYGVTYKVLDNHDGELMPDLHVRLQIIRLIRNWNADVVIGPRANDYHPDHRNTAILVQDAAYMVIVPNVAPDTPPLKKNPVFLYVQDNFQKPNSFSPDIAIDISDVIDRKMYGVSAHHSQFFEWLPWLDGELESIPKRDKERMNWMKERWTFPITNDVRKSLERWYGADKARTITEAEAFEICEYGRYPDENEIRRLFPMIEKK